MKTIQEIKDEVAAEGGYKTWDLLHYAFAGYGKQIERFSDKVAKRYAEEALREAAEIRHEFSYGIVAIDKKSVLNLLKELK